MDIPYGRSNFEEIRRRGYFYVDKTPLLPLLESAQIGFPLFLRPRRFGKSTLLSMLEHYYDLGRAEQFDELFKGLWVHEHPTAERSSYLVLSFDFSQVATGRGPEALFRTFFETVRSGVEDLLLSYRERVPELVRLDDRLVSYQDPEALMATLMRLVRRSGHKLYVLIDEYDHFANRLLAGGSQDLYEAIVKDTGFVRTFFATLKAGTGQGAVGRMFITGVSPLMLDDLSSGFNIVTSISTSAGVNTLAGFTHADVERALDEFLVARPHLAGHVPLGDRGELLRVLESFYDGYRFSPQATERVFNSDMVLYFLREFDDRGQYPDEMLDQNVRTEYGHLQRIGAQSGTGTVERLGILETILGEGRIRSELVRQFGVKRLGSRAPFISLLYYLGMLTLGDAPRDAIGYDLVIPNRVIRELQWEHLALMLKDQERLEIRMDDLNAALGAMVAEGDIAPFLRLFHSQVLKALGVKDTRRLDEKTIKLLFMTYASLGRAFHPLSEKEFAQGYCDLFLGASRSVPSARYSWLLEFKYLPAGVKPAQIESAFAEAEGQVARYASDADLLPLLVGDRELKAGMIVLVGTKQALFRPWPPEPAPPPPSRRSGSPSSESPSSEEERAARPPRPAARARKRT